MKVTADLNSCLKRDQAWTKCSVQDVLQVPFSVLTWRFACSGGWGGLRGARGAVSATVPAASEAGALSALLM